MFRVINRIIPLKNYSIYDKIYLRYFVLICNKRLFMAERGVFMDYWKNIGTNIRLLRKNRGLTIEDLACVLDIAPGFLGLVERGTRGVSLANLARICMFFNVTMDQLVKGRVEVEPYVADADALRGKVNDLAFSLTDEEIKVITGNMKKVLTLKHRD